MQPVSDRYMPIEVVGTGGMSVVWRARDLKLGRDVAIKVLRPARSGQWIADRLWSEARCAASLDHPNVARVYDAGLDSPGSANPTPYVVMELLDGPSLAQRLALGALPWPDATRTCAEVASALAAAHAAGIVHRDVKPSNIVLGPTGSKVVDFGIATGPDQPADRHDDPALGTPAYLSPERLRGEPASAAGDVYALGLTLYACLAGQLPWPGLAGHDAIEARCHLAPEPLPAIDGLPAVVERMVASCLAPDPMDRPTSARLAAALRSAVAIAMPTVPAPVRPSTLDIGQPARRMHGPGARWPMAVGVAGVAAAVLAGLLSVLGPPSASGVGPTQFGPSDGSSPCVNTVAMPDQSSAGSTVDDCVDSADRSAAVDFGPAAPGSEDGGTGGSSGPAATGSQPGQGPTAPPPSPGVPTLATTSAPATNSTGPSPTTAPDPPATVTPSATPNPSASPAVSTPSPLPSPSPTAASSVPAESPSPTALVYDARSTPM